MDIKPIETVYNGYRFRSRLEARWAVFFDAAGIEYQYEPEGFVLSEGVRYLPDFFLPKLSAYVEIKRNNLDEDSLYDAEQKCESLQVDKDCVVLLCQGDPVDMNITAFFSMWNDELEMYECSYDSACFVKNASWWIPFMYSDAKAGITSKHGNPDDVYIAIGDEDYNITTPFGQKCLIDRCLIIQGSYFGKERKIARQARFEHGETPRIRR